MTALLAFWLAMLSLIKSEKLPAGTIEHQALGEMFSLGTFYDAKRNLFYTGDSFWSQKDLKNYTVKTYDEYSHADALMDENALDRVYILGVDASLQLSLMGGMISVYGAAQYLRDEKDDDHTARVTLTYKAVTGRDRLQVFESVPTYGDLNELCDDIKGNTKVPNPTHVVTSILYGMRANFVFDRKYGGEKYLQDIGGQLRIEIKTASAFELGIDASVELKSNTNHSFEDDSISFYGDTLVSSVPATKVQAAKMMTEIMKDANKSRTPISYQLTPLKHFCPDIASTIVELDQMTIDKTTRNLVELEAVMQRVKSLLRLEPARRFASVRKALITYEMDLMEFTLNMKTKVAETLMKYREGTAHATDFADIATAYAKSNFNKESAKEYLDQRTRELKSIELVTNEAHNTPQIMLSDIGAATDNKCIFKHRFATVYDIYILPDKISGQNGWFNNYTRVANMGETLKDFAESAKINANDNHCFLIRMHALSSNNHATKDGVIRLFEYGRQKEGDFKIPTAPSPPKCEHNMYSRIKLSASPNNDEKSYVNGIRVTATWRKLKPIMSKKSNDKDSKDDKKKDDNKKKETYEYFPTYFDVDNTGSFEIEGLRHSKEYNITLAYIVKLDGSIGVASEPVFCTTAATSAPLGVEITHHSATSLRLRWNAPQYTGREEGALEDASKQSDVRYRVIAYAYEDFQCINKNKDSKGSNYRGNKDKTAENYPCKPWNKVENAPDEYKKEPLGNNNFCRYPKTHINGTENMPGPFCYITDDRWELLKKQKGSGVANVYACGIPICQTTAGNKVPKRRIDTTTLDAELINLLPATQYYVHVQAFRGNALGDSAEVPAHTVPFPPNAPTVTTATTNAVTLEVNLENWEPPTGATVNSMVFRYYKLDFETNEVMYGTDITVSKEITGGSKIVRKILDNLDSGVLYEFKCRVRMTVGTRPHLKLLETEDSQGVIQWTRTSGPTRDEATEKWIAYFNRQLELGTAQARNEILTLSDAEHKQSDQFRNTFTNLKKTVTDYEATTVGKFTTENLLLGAILKQSCIQRGVKFLAELDTDKTHYSTKPPINTEFECLENCRTTDAEFVQFAVHGNKKGECVCRKGRTSADVATVASAEHVIVNRWCYDVSSASDTKYARCALVDSEYKGGAEISTEEPVTNIVDCVRRCTEVDSCATVAWTAKGWKCTFKQKAFKEEEKIDGQISLTLSCLAKKD